MSNRYLRPPIASEVAPCTYVGREDILRFVEWARLFHGLETDKTDDELADIVQGMVGGNAAPRESQVGKAVCMIALAATKQVYQARHRADMARTALAFPKVEFRSMEHSRCAAAALIDGARFSPSEFPLLPLPGCDLDNCMCGSRQLTARRARM